MTQAQTEALALLRAYIVANPDVHQQPSAADRQKHYRLFELCACYELDMLLWTSLPPDKIAAASVTAAKKHARGSKLGDHGVDCATADLHHVAQVKWYAPGHSITFKTLATFFALGVGILRAEKLTLVMSEGAIVENLAGELPVECVRILDARIDELVWLAAGTPLAENEPIMTFPHISDPARLPIPARAPVTPERAADAKLSNSDLTWESHYCQIRDFVTTHGRIPTIKDNYNGARFGAWLKHYQCVGGTYQKILPLERQEQLMAIPGWWFTPEGYATGRVLVPKPD